MKNRKKLFVFDIIRIMLVIITIINGIMLLALFFGDRSENIISIVIDKVDLVSMFTSIIISAIPFFLESRIREILLAILGKKKNRKKIKKENYHNIYKIDIIEKFSKAQFQKNTIALISVTFCLAICLCLRTFLIFEINRMVLVILIILAWLIVIHQFLLAYRVKKQYYGTNYEEAKELLRFVEQSKDDAPHSGKYVFNDEIQSAPATDKFVEYES